MTSLNKKRKCRRTLLDRGGEKGHFYKLKRHALYHKKDRKHYNDLAVGELRNNNIMNASTNGGVAKKSKAKHGHSSYRHKGTYGPAIDYSPNDQRQIDSFNEQLKGDK